jgi:hypothetical protein
MHAAVFAMQELQIAGVNFKAFDLGGHEIARKVWKDYYAKVSSRQCPSAVPALCISILGDTCKEATRLPSSWSVASREVPLAKIQPGHVANSAFLALRPTGFNISILQQPVSGPLTSSALSGATAPASPTYLSLQPAPGL